MESKVGVVDVKVQVREGTTELPRLKERKNEIMCDEACVGPRVEMRARATETEACQLG